MRSFRLVPLAGILWLLFVGARPATITYTIIDDGICRFSFPSNYATNIEGDVAMYSIQAESLNFDVHRFYTANVESIIPTSTATGFKTRAATRTSQQQNTSFVQTLQQATGGQIISQGTVTTNGKQGSEVEINFTNPESEATKMYTRFYWIGDNMYVFSLTASVNENSALSTAKQSVFGSIQFL